MRSLFVALLLTTTFAFAQGTKITAPKNKYPVAEDIKVGKEAAAEVTKQLPLLPENGDIDAYVKRVGKGLVAAIPSEFQHPEFKYEFRVVNASDINAFALPGGPMFVNRGMIESAHNEGEMAGVMAHELSHVALRHGTAAETKATSTGVTLGTLGGAIAGAVLGGNIGKAVAQGTQLGLGTYMLRFSRTDEAQADMLGAHIMAAAGYDPQDLANMFKTIESKAGGSGPQFLSDHPNPENRYEKISQEAKLLTVAANARANQAAEFGQAQAVLKAMTPARTTAELEAAKSNNSASPARGGGNTPTPSKVERPSTQYTTFEQSGVFSTFVPSNWKSFRDSDSVTFAPDGAFGNQQGQSVFTHGAIAGIVTAGSTNLATASDRYISGLIQGNAYLMANRAYTRTTIDSRTALQRQLTGTSPVTHRQEVVDVYTTFLKNGQLFYIINVAPFDEQSQYRSAFDAMIRSMRLAR